MMKPSDTITALIRSLIFGTVLALSSHIHAFSAVLKWDIPVNERLEVVRTAQVEKHINLKLSDAYDERNIIDLTCYEKEGDSSKVRGLFSVYEKRQGENVFLLKKQYKADFTIDPLGRFHVAPKQIMPNLRSIPSFPERELQPGASWSENGELVIHDFSIPFKLVFPVAYRLERVETDGGRATAVIAYSFTVDKTLNDQKYPEDFPQKIFGKNMGEIRWDTVANRPVQISDMYKIIFLFRSAGRFSIVELRMNLKSSFKIYQPITPEQEKKEKEELEKKFPGGSGIDVDLDKRGLVLRMGDILFDFDSHRLTKDAVKKLDEVIDVLKKKYPDREIIVEGHTDSIGKRDYNMNLSRKRAESVAQYLGKKMENDKLSYRGLGPDSPIADNSSKEGRQKNRRVEIIIKLR